jgi:hypothetical protein
VAAGEGRTGRRGPLSREAASSDHSQLYREAGGTEPDNYDLLDFDPQGWDPQDCDLQDCDPQNCDPQDCDPQDCDPQDCDPPDCEPQDCESLDCDPQDFIKEGQWESRLVVKKDISKDAVGQVGRRPGG